MLAESSRPQHNPSERVDMEGLLTEITQATNFRQSSAWWIDITTPPSFCRRSSGIRRFNGCGRQRCPVQASSDRVTRDKGAH
jgi:hypothetical protein